MEIATRDDKKDFDRNGGNGSPFSRRYINKTFFFFFFFRDEATLIWAKYFVILDKKMVTFCNIYRFFKRVMFNTIFWLHITA